jgi:hypothetical protein
MLFLNFSTGPFESFKSAYYGAADEFKDKEVKFLIGDLEASQGAFQVGFLFSLLLKLLSNLFFSLMLTIFFVRIVVLWSEGGSDTTYPHSGHRVQEVFEGTD